jgi:acetyl esterase/lipase
MKHLTTALLALALILGFSQAQTAAPKTPATPKPKSTAKPKAQAKPAAPAIKPTLANVPYGSDPSQVVDFYKSSSKTPAPLMLFIHGGGWNGGSKDRVIGLKECLDAGLAVVSVEYRFVPKAHAAGIKPPGIFSENTIGPPNAAAIAANPLFPKKPRLVTGSLFLPQIASSAAIGSFA